MIPKYGISLDDLSQPRFAILNQTVIRRVTPNMLVVNAEPDSLDGSAIILECDRENALNILAVIRLKEPNKNLLRFWELRGKKGKRL